MTGWRSGIESAAALRCPACRRLYKEKDQAVKFDDLPADWTCPVCKAGKESFEQVA